MAIRLVPVEGAFNGTSPQTVRTHPADATDSVLVGFSFVNDLSAPNDRTVLVRHKVTGPIYSGAYREPVPAGEANKNFAAGSLGTNATGEEIEAVLDGSGTFRWQAIFRETYT